MPKKKQHKYKYDVTLTIVGTLEIEGASSDPDDYREDAIWGVKRSGEVVDADVKVEVLE